MGETVMKMKVITLGKTFLFLRIEGLYIIEQLQFILLKENKKYKIRIIYSNSDGKEMFMTPIEFFKKLI